MLAIAPGQAISTLPPTDITQRLWFLTKSSSEIYKTLYCLWRTNWFHLKSVGEVYLWNRNTVMIPGSHSALAANQPNIFWQLSRLTELHMMGPIWHIYWNVYNLTQKIVNDWCKIKLFINYIAYDGWGTIRKLWKSYKASKLPGAVLRHCLSWELSKDRVKDDLPRWGPTCVKCQLLTFDPAPITRQHQKYQ